MSTTIVGFPRIGEHRELKFITEKYFRSEIDEAELFAQTKALRYKHWRAVADSGISDVPVNDFSLYDTVLDTAFLLNIVPKAVQQSTLTDVEKYFALARGYQGEKGDLPAWPLKKWFNTNYHYIVPHFDADTNISLVGTKVFDEFAEAQSLGLNARPVILGPYTLLQLATFAEGVQAEQFVDALVRAYSELVQRLVQQGATWIQIDEPALVKDVSTEQFALFAALHRPILTNKGTSRVLLQTYFGDVRDHYQDLLALDFDGYGLDFVEGRRTAELVRSGFPDDKVLYAGVVNGKNIWRNHYAKTVELVQSLPVAQVVLSTSCSLLHVPYSTEQERFAPDVLQHFAFALEKLTELTELDAILSGDGAAFLATNNALFATERVQPNEQVAQRIAALNEDDFVRQPALAEREVLQNERFKLPVLPTTTIGSFPQTTAVRQNRASFRKGERDQDAYEAFIKVEIDDWLRWQEEAGLDVLVHGEFERNDMVEYFGENLSGYLFSTNGWVQSYGTRGVKPPIIWGDVARARPITVPWSAYAQSRTDKPVKGMLTGPVTILNWSFPREDVSLALSTKQIALAIRDEVLDLEAAGISIIQIDEAALREKLPLRQSDWYSEYLDWAVPSFRLVHSGVRPETQIHTHMCYSEFTDIIPAIQSLDADVISFEASRSNLAILDELKRQNFQLEVGPGVYDIHSPRIPSVEEVTRTIRAILAKVPLLKVWINPDCGLKTRGITETRASLVNVTTAVKQLRKEL